jgi:hypothetical protein
MGVKDRLKQAGSGSKQVAVTVVNKANPSGSKLKKLMYFILFLFYLITIHQSFTKPFIVDMLEKYVTGESDNFITQIMSGVLKGGCRIGNMFVLMDSLTNYLFPCVELFPDVTTVYGAYTADPTERSDIKEITESGTDDIWQALGFEDFDFEAETGEDLSTEEKETAMRAQMRSVWESQHAGGMETLLDQPIDFKIKKVRLMPERINGWIPSDPSGGAGDVIGIAMDVQNIGMKSIDVVGWFNCTSPRSDPDICELGGFTYYCGDTGPATGIEGKDDLLMKKCVYDESVLDEGEYYECVYYTNIQGSGTDQAICDDVYVGTNIAGDGDGVDSSTLAIKKLDESYEDVIAPYSWCFTIIDNGGVPGSVEAYIDGNAVTEFVGRAVATVKLLDEDEGEYLLFYNLLNFAKPITVNKEAPVKFSFDLPEGPFLVRDVENYKVATINYETQSDGNIEEYRFYVVKLSENLEAYPYADGDDWVCVDGSLFSNTNHVNKSHVANALKLQDSDILALNNSEYPDDLIQALWTDYQDLYLNRKKEYTFCFLNLTDREKLGYVSVLENLKFKVKEKIPEEEGGWPDNQDRSTALIGVDTVYDFKSELGPAVLTIDCTYKAFKDHYGEDVYTDQVWFDMGTEDEECREISDWDLC